MMKKQRGVALLVAMLIVAIATIVATQIFYQQQINIRRTMNQVQAEQLYQLALSSEVWVKTMLKEDLALEDVAKVHVDSFADNWAQPILLPLAEGAKVSLKITDAQSCFNINNLVLNGKTPQPEQIKMLQNLMTLLKLNPELVWSLVDWLDENDEPNPNGAELETYSRLTPAYRTANYRIIELNELYAISGWNSETINALSPYICALPPIPKMTNAGRFFPNSTEISRINVNTASEVVLRSLVPEMQNVNLSPILQMRKTMPFKSLDLFWTQFEKDNPSFWKQFSVDTKKNPGLKAISKSTLTLLLSVNSRYFMMEYSALLDEFSQNYRSIIYRPAATSTASAAKTASAPTDAAQTQSEQENPTAATNSETESPAAATDESATSGENPETTAATSNVGTTTTNPATASTTATAANKSATTTQPATGLTTSSNKTAANPDPNAQEIKQISTLYRSQYY